MENSRIYTAFAGERLVASGQLAVMLRRTREFMDHHWNARILIFEDQSGAQVDFDMRGEPEEVAERALRAAETPPEPPRPGRPKLGVVCREVSLLPRHWEWLEAQPNGISAALRRLVDEARKRSPGPARAIQARGAVGRIMTALAGDFAGYEEATRALYAGDRERFAGRLRDWPVDVKTYLERLADEGAWG